jgi:hypothetical protein
LNSRRPMPFIGKEAKQCPYGDTCHWLSFKWDTLSLDHKTSMSCPNGTHTESQWIQAKQQQRVFTSSVVSDISGGRGSDRGGKAQKVESAPASTPSCVAVSKVNPEAELGFCDSVEAFLMALPNGTCNMAALGFKVQNPYGTTAAIRQGNGRTTKVILEQDPKQRFVVSVTTGAHSVSLRDGADADAAAVVASPQVTSQLKRAPTPHVGSGAPMASDGGNATEMGSRESAPRPCDARNVVDPRALQIAKSFYTSHYQHMRSIRTKNDLRSYFHQVMQVSDTRFAQVLYALVHGDGLKVVSVHGQDKNNLELRWLRHSDSSGGRGGGGAGAGGADLGK